MDALMNFEPVLLEGQTAHLITAARTLDVEVVALGALPEYQHDFGALVATVWKTDQEVANLEMGQWELSQLRMRVLDDIKLQFNNLAPTKQWRTAKTNFYLTRFPGIGDEMRAYLFKASEFFVFQDNTPRFEFLSPVVSATSRVIFSGWRFKVKEISKRGVKTLWVSGWPSGLGAK